ncbi:MAG: hypothetical protein ACE5GB_04700 [Acidimicrobiales bacterium]
MAADDVTEDHAQRSVSIGGDDWPAQAADTVVRVVDRVKTATTDRVVLLVRVLVYGLVVAVLGLATLVMTVIVMVRMADAYLPIGAGVGSATWAAHAFIGGLLTVVGVGAWLSRRETFKPLVVAGIVDVAAIIAIVGYGIIDGVS